MIETTLYKTVNGKTTKVEPKTEKTASKTVPELKETVIENNTDQPKEKK